MTRVNCIWYALVKNNAAEEKRYTKISVKILRKNMKRYHAHVTSIYEMTCISENNNGGQVLKKLDRSICESIRIIITDGV